MHVVVIYLGLYSFRIILFAFAALLSFPVRVCMIQEPMEAFSRQNRGVASMTISVFI